MSRYSKLRFVLVTGLFALGVAACGEGEGGTTTADAAGTEGTARIINVETLDMQPRSFTNFVNLTGAAAANRDVVVSAEEAGVIREIYVQKGASVATGQPIARIDSRVLSAQMDQMRAQAELARENWERQRRLWEQDSIGSEMLYIQARQNWQMADANARALGERLANMVVRAPIAGVVEDRMVEVGTLVAPGTPIARVLDVDPVKVIAGVPERYAGAIGRGAAVEMGVAALGGRAFAGRVSFVGAAVDPASRTVPIEISVPNPDGALRPGMVAELRVASGELTQALVVPQQAVQRSEDGYFVYVVTERQSGGPIAEARPITMGESQGGLVPIESGLAVGDQVVISGQHQVAAGDLVTVSGGASER